MPNAVLSETNRLQPCLTYEGYKCRQRKGREAWLCCRKFCRAKVIVVDGKARLLEDHAENCAPSSQQELERNMLRASSKRKAAESLDSRPAKVLRRCLGESGYENIEIRDTKLIRQSIYRQRRKAVPALPKTHMNLRWRHFGRCNCTRRPVEQFVYVSDGGIVLLTCRSNLEMLSKCKTWLGDGTFDRAPALFKGRFW